MRDYESIDAADSDMPPTPRKGKVKRPVAQASSDARFSGSGPHVLARIPSLATADPALIAESSAEVEEGRTVSSPMSKRILAGGLVVLVAGALVTAVWQFSDKAAKNLGTDRQASLPRIEVPAPTASEAPAWNGATTDTNTWQAGTRGPANTLEGRSPGGRNYGNNWGDPTDTASRDPAVGDSPWNGANSTDQMQTARSSWPAAPNMSPSYRDNLEPNASSEGDYNAYAQPSRANRSMTVGERTGSSAGYGRAPGYRDERTAARPDYRTAGRERNDSPSGQPASPSGRTRDSADRAYRGIGNTAGTVPDGNRYPAPAPQTGGPETGNDYQGTNYDYADYAALAGMAGARPGVAPSGAIPASYQDNVAPPTGATRRSREPIYEARRSSPEGGYPSPSTGREPSSSYSQYNYPSTPYPTTEARTDTPSASRMSRDGGSSGSQAMGRLEGTIQRAPLRGTY